MGVLGLWSLLDPVGKPIPIESLENKILAVDISIWLNQAVKGFRDRSGNSVPNAHLLGLYHRLCKLLFYRIKPVFVFDGRAPQLKRDTLQRRRMRRSKDARRAQATSARIIDNYLKSQAVAQKLKRQTFAVEKVVKKGTEGLHHLLSRRGAEKEKDLFDLPDLPESQKGLVASSDESDVADYPEEELLGVDTSDIYTVDVNSPAFACLPKYAQYDLLRDMREKRKQNSWAKMHEMPHKAESFSSFQLERLKHRRAMQKTLEDVSEDLNQNLQTDMEENPNLFVGDVQGVKEMKSSLKRMVAQSGATLFHATGLKEVKERLKAEERERRQRLEAEAARQLAQASEVRELRSEIGTPTATVGTPASEDDDELQAAIALSLEQERGAPSQAEIYRIIKAEQKEEGGDDESVDDPSAEFVDSTPGPSTAGASSHWTKFGGRGKKQQLTKGKSSRVKTEPIADDDDDDDDVIVLLPDVSVIFSNRLGGQFRTLPGIKKEAAGDDEDVSMSNKSITARVFNVKVEPKEETEDLFADIFTTREAHTAVDKLITRAAGPETSGAVVDGQDSGDGGATSEDSVGVMSGSDSEGETGMKIVDKPPTRDGVKSKPDSGWTSKNLGVGSKNSMACSSSNVDDNVGVMSDDSSSSGGDDDDAPDTVEKDIFADIFADSTSVVKLDEIIQGKSKPDTGGGPKKPVSESNPEVEDLLAKVSRLDKPTDIFAIISRQAAGSETSSNTGTKNKEVATVANDVELEDEEEDPDMIVESMQNSRHLYMQIASKYAAEAVKLSPAKKRTTVSQCSGTGTETSLDLKRTITESSTGQKKPRTEGMVSAPDRNSDVTVDLATAQTDLVREMHEREKRERLLRYTTRLDYNSSSDSEAGDVGDESTAVGNTEHAKGTKHTDHDSELSRLGIKAINADSYAQQVLQSEGIIVPEPEAGKKPDQQTRGNLVAENTNQSVNENSAQSVNQPTGQQPPVTNANGNEISKNSSKAQVNYSQNVAAGTVDSSPVVSVTIPVVTSPSASSPTVSSSAVVYSSSVPGFSRSSKDAKGGEVVVQVDTSHYGRDDNAPCDNNNTAPSPIPVAAGHENADETISEAELYAIQAELARENASLVAEMGQAERVANSITDQMYSECQELLQLFGVPWIVAPSEAEAQCAYLDSSGLTHGTITDDSDIWLFGGQKVYKNFFNQDKHVEFFNYSEVAQHFGLNREKLCLLAMLTGSDYTEGVEGVGPVTALEVLAEFPGDGLKPLVDLKSWWERVQKEFGKDYGMPIGNKVREKLRKLKLGVARFPSEAVLEAYLRPELDTSTERFTWAVPNLVAVRDFAQERFGWTKFQTDEILLPVIRALQKNRSQARIDNYFNSYRTQLPDKGGLQGSKRVEEALRRVKGLPPSPEKKKTTTTTTHSPSKQKPRAKSPLGSAAGGTAEKSAKPSAVNSGKSAGRKSGSSAAAATQSAAVRAAAAGKRGKAVLESEATSTAANISTASSTSAATGTAATKQTGSLVHQSEGFVPGQDVIYQRLEREKRAADAKAAAAAIFRRSRAAKQTAAAKKTRQKFKRPDRVELAEGHDLSDSD